MQIHEMGNKECLEALARLSFGRLGCARDNQPYIVPIYFACHDRHLYTFSMDGQKNLWMRANPRVCVEADEVTSPVQWLSVLVLGRYEELPDTPEYKYERSLAYEMLGQRAGWWDPASAAPAHGGAGDPPVPVLFRIHIDEMTGHQAVPDPAERVDSPSSASAGEAKGFLSRVLRRIRIV